MAENVSMMGTAAITSGTMIVVRPANLVTESSETVPSAKPSVRAPESPMKTEAGWKLYRRNPSEEPATAMESAAASRRPAWTESTNIVRLARVEIPAASPSRPSIRLMMFV